MRIKTDCHGEVEILDCAWYNILNYGFVFGENLLPKCIGIVKMKNSFGEEKQYIGLGLGIDEKIDIRYVLDTGVRFYGSFGMEG